MTNSIDDSRYVKAMSHPLRVSIMAMLGEHSASPVELARHLEVSLGTIAYHVRTLHRLELIELINETQVRGSIQHHYRAVKRPTVSDEAWAQAPPIARHVAVRSSLQLIGEYLRFSADQGGFERPEAHLARSRLRLDQEGWEKAAKVCGRLLDEIEEIEREAAERLGDEPHEDEIVEAGVVTMLFEAARLSGKRSAANERTHEVEPA